MMLKIVPFTQEFVNSIETDFDFPESMRAAFNSGNDVMGFAVIGDKNIVAVGGVHEMWQGVAEGWVILSKHAYPWKVSLARYAKTLFEVILKNKKLHRVQASVHAENLEAIKFAEWMGFKKEGVMAKFGPDRSDYFRMAKVI